MSEENKITAYIRVGNEYQLSGKNRIKEIKKRLEKHTETKHDKPVSDYYQFDSDVAYLLSKLEIAENALEELAENAQPATIIAEVALNKIRE